MVKMKVAVIGAGGVGKYHAREYSQYGCNVVAIAGSSEGSSKKSSENLKTEFEIHAKPYWDIDMLISKEKIDAVSICTPIELHPTQVQKFLKAGVHVLCEKPLVFSDADSYLVAKELFALAKKKNLILTVNTQWAAIAKYFEDKPLKKFFVYMEPGAEGKNFIIDHLPHANSLLVELMPYGKISNLHFGSIKNNEIKIMFAYYTDRETCDVTYHFKYKRDSPRRIIFGFNDDKFTRVLGKNYEQTLRSDKRAIPIEDPLRTSVRKFIDAATKKIKPLVEESRAMENIQLQDAIYSEYLKISEKI